MRNVRSQLQARRASLLRGLVHVLEAPPRTRAA
jgi:hypothetical protein